jgi:hypothetical protein
MSISWSMRFVAALFCACVTENFAAAQGSIRNLSSAEFPWVLANPTNPEYLPPPSGAGPITYDKAHPHIARLPDQFGNVVERILPLADLNNPNLMPWVVEFLRKANDRMLARQLRYSSRASCLPAGVPMFWRYGAGFQPVWFMQTPRKITMINIGDSQIRQIYMDVPHSLDFRPSWFGESTGRYEGEELVIDTVGFNGKTMLDDTYNVPQSTQLHVIERLKLIEDGKQLELNFTIDDPGAFYTPWSGILRFRRTPRETRLSEQPCAENNIDALGNRYDSPIATTPDF